MLSLQYFQVLHGNLEFYIGRLKYPDSPKSVRLEIILPVIFTVILIMAVMALLVWYKTKYATLVHKEKELLERLRNLQGKLSLPRAFSSCYLKS